MKIKYILIIVLIVAAVYLIYKNKKDKDQLLIKDVDATSTRKLMNAAPRPRFRFKVKKKSVSRNNVEMVVTKKKSEKSEKPKRSKVIFTVAKYVKKRETIIGDIVITLFDDIVPKTCENFKSFARIEYNNTDFFNYKKGSFFCGGDYDKNDGSGETPSQYGLTFEDENFDVKHDKPYMISMLNNGSPDTNNAKFIITLKPMPSFDGKYVAFGRVKFGKKVIKQIDSEKKPCEIYITRSRIIDE